MSEESQTLVHIISSHPLYIPVMVINIYTELAEIKDIKFKHVKKKLRMTDVLNTQNKQKTW